MDGVGERKRRRRKEEEGKEEEGKEGETEGERERDFLGLLS